MDLLFLKAIEIPNQKYLLRKVESQLIRSNWKIICEVTWEKNPYKLLPQSIQVNTRNILGGRYFSQVKIKNKSFLEPIFYATI